MLNKIYVKSFKTVDARYTISAFETLPLFFDRNIVYTTHTTSVLSFCEKEKKQRYSVGDGSSDQKSMQATLNCVLFS